MIGPNRVTIGFGVGTQPPLTRLRFMTRMARTLGFDAAWTVDHFLGFFPQSIWDKEFSWIADPESSPHPHYDYQALNGYLTRYAGKMQIAVGVTEAVRRHPMLLAQYAMTMSHLASSPPILGIGAGEAENTVPYGFDFHRPVGRLEEALRIIRKCFESKGPFAFDGEFYTFDRAVMDLEPKPGNEPQIWVAAHGPRMLRLCGEHGDGWWPVLPYSPDEYAESLAKIRMAATAAGRDPAAIVPGLSTFAVIGRSEKEARALLEAPPLRFLALLAPDYVWKRCGYTHPLGDGFGGLVDFIPQDFDRSTMYSALRDVPTDVVAENVIWGTPDTVYKRFEGLVEAGLRHIAISPVAALVSKRHAVSALRHTVALARKLRSLEV